MGAPTQYKFSLKEVTEALISAQKIESGKWMIGFEMGMNVGNFLAEPNAAPGDEARPGALLVINNLMLVSIPPEAPAEGAPHYVVDAAELKKSST